jgi:RNA polymerase sigma-70 factor (ECF subfamily)
MDPNPATMDFLPLIRKINSDPDAFGEIVTMFEGRLLRYVMRISGVSYEDAENLVQDIFIKVYRNINEYDERWDFSGWIFRIAHNATIDGFRKSKKEMGNVSLDDEEYDSILDTVSDGNTPHKELRSKELKSCVQKAISHLPAEYREIILLRCIEGYSYEAISDILKIPIGTASTLVNRARKQLRTLLETFHCGQ